MSSLDVHKENPGPGVVSTDLFVYDAKAPGSGGMVSVTHPAELTEGETVYIKTPHMSVTMRLTRADNVMQVIIAHLHEPFEQDSKTFKLTSDYLKQKKASLNLLFSKWKIVALIDGEPLAETSKK